MLPRKIFNMNMKVYVHTKDPTFNLRDSKDILTPSQADEAVSFNQCTMHGPS